MTHHLLKRSNFASQNPGVIVVFCILFLIAVGLLGVFIVRKRRAQRDSRPQVFA